MPDILIEEAWKRGRQEAERRELQYSIDEAYYAEVDRVEGARRRKTAREEASRRRKEQAANASLKFLCYGAQLAWIALCVFVSVDQSWGEVAALDGFFWRKEWLAYIALFIVFV